MNNKVKAKICFITSLIVLIGIPLIVTIIKFNVIKSISQQSTSVKISIIASIIILILFMAFFKRIIKFLKSFNKVSIGTCVFKGIMKLLPLASFLIILSNVISYINDLLYIVSWIVGCATISFLVLDPITEYFIYKANKDEQQSVLVEALKDANDKNKV